MQLRSGQHHGRITGIAQQAREALRIGVAWQAHGARFVNQRDATPARLSRMRDRRVHTIRDRPRRAHDESQASDADRLIAEIEADHHAVRREKMAFRIATGLMVKQT